MDGGKTHVALGIAHAVSCGSTFLRWKAPEARSVLYVDGEMPQQALQERLNALQKASGSRALSDSTAWIANRSGKPSTWRT